jgi:hypothetical protein
MQHKELMEAGKEIAESRQAAAVEREAPETDVGAHGLLETMRDAQPTRCCFIAKPPMTDDSQSNHGYYSSYLSKGRSDSEVKG